MYAIPYEGQEIKLHWANADQYYVKSSEQFRDYTFRVGTTASDHRSVHFKLVEADTPTNNNLPRTNRTTRSQEPRFLLATEAPVVSTSNLLTIRFEYRADDEGRKQKDINETTIESILIHPAARDWRTELALAASSDEDATSLLAKHLNSYTAKNTFDYFIHKDLGGFLRRELDFYLKNELMHLDDIDTDDGARGQIESQLRKLRAVRRVGHKLIDFLAQIEDFQKRLWLKKKIRRRNSVVRHLGPRAGTIFTPRLPQTRLSARSGFDSLPSTSSLTESLRRDTRSL